MSDPRKDLPPVTAPNFLEKVRESLQTYLGNRGNALDQGLTRRDLQDFGLVDKLVSNRVGSILPGAMAGALDGIGGDTGMGDGEIYEPDLTPPPTPTGFTAAAAIINLLVSCDSPSYIQGHGHAKSRLYGSKHRAAAGVCQCGDADGVLRHSLQLRHRSGDNLALVADLGDRGWG